MNEGNDRVLQCRDFNGLNTDKVVEELAIVFNFKGSVVVLSSLNDVLVNLVEVENVAHHVLQKGL